MAMKNAVKLHDGVNYFKAGTNTYLVTVHGKNVTVALKPMGHNAMAAAPVKVTMTTKQATKGVNGGYGCVYQYYCWYDVYGRYWCAYRYICA